MNSVNRPEWMTDIMISRALGGSKDIVNIKIEPAVSSGENYLSTILRAEIEFKKENQNDKAKENSNQIHKTSLIFKTFPVGFLKQFIIDNGMLMKELKMYTCILPIMTDILGGKYLAPKYLESCKKDVLILQDLKLENYKVTNRIERLDLEHCISAIQTLADFHGASFIMNKKHSQVMECVKNEVFYTKDNIYQKQFVISCFDIVSNEIKSWPGCENYSIRLKKVSEKVWNSVTEVMIPKSGDLMVLNHGDFWTNNILYKYDDTNKIIGVKFVDFQFSRWTTPAIDLQEFITTSVRNKDLYLPKIKDRYLERLNQHMNPHGQNLTHNELEYLLNQAECFSLLVSVCTLPMALLNPSKALDFSTMAENELIEPTDTNNPLIYACKDEVYKNVFPKLLKHFDALGLL